MSVLLNPRLWIAILVMLTVDLAMQSGAYEPLVSRNSQAGATLRSLNALSLRGANDVDTVTLGSSVANFGLDHARIAARTRALGYGYANLALPGSALMTFRQWAQWLPVHVPSARSGLLVLGPNDLLAMGNGSYELALVAPLKRLGDGLWWRQHVPFDSSDFDTYGLFSGLALYRKDLQQLSAHPHQRLRELGWWRKQLRRQDYLVESTALDGDICQIDLSTPAACLNSARPSSMSVARFEGIREVCRQLSITSQAVSDWRLDVNVPQDTRDAATLARGLVSQLNWQRRMLILVLPMHPLWEVGRAKGTRLLMAATYQPLVAAKLVRYLDYQDIFSDAGVQPCQVFHDMYHLNRMGQKIVTDKLLPDLDWIYQSARR